MNRIPRRTILGLFGAVAAGYAVRDFTHSNDGFSDSIEQLFSEDGFYVAHRGGGGSKPEHTIAAYDSAVNAGLKAIEVSCHISLDGTLFAMHDPTLDRMTNGKWKGSHSSWKWRDLREKVKIVSSPLLGPGWPDQQIPTVREILDRYLGRVVVFLEAKSERAVAPLIELINSYPNANRSIVWKNYYTSPSFTSAKKYGFKTWAYIDDTTSRGQLDRFDADIDSWGVPITSSDRQFQMVLSRSGAKPVIAWPIVRKAERDRVMKLNHKGHYVKGIMCSEPLYVPRRKALQTSSAFDRGILSPGDLSASIEYEKYALKFNEEEAAAYCAAVKGHGILMGSMCPITSGAIGYKIAFDMMFPSLPEGKLHAGIFFGQASDSKHQFGASNPESCYRLAVRPNSGEIQLYTVDAGAIPGVQIGNLRTSPIKAGAWIPLEVAVDPSKVILQRGTGEVKVITDTFTRGLYFGIHNGSIEDEATIPMFRNLRVISY
ncbi:glycerophosphodiester phosphodiesterase family protein [Streptomyces sp. NPDC006283]|uniref:glycerophosphodiester phosphodiesterase n=1 Tax=Streptomyces sp. NPDC006283 TaxID=3156741 RepID=UPI0033BF84C3